jgi:CRP/FNR family cyclic AMP-dependent transcriptional regulator
MARRDADLLARVPLFAGLPKRHLRNVASIAKHLALGEGSAVAKEGEQGDDFYVIASGQARVVRGGRTIAQLMPGDFFGEIALLDGGPRTASVVAETPIELLVLNRKSFQKILERDPAVVLKMLAELALRLRNVERTLTG